MGELMSMFFLKKYKWKNCSFYSTNSVNDLLNQKLLKLLPKYTGGWDGLYFNILCLQTNYIKPGYHKINIQMNLEDLKKLRGFEITNSN